MLLKSVRVKNYKCIEDSGEFTVKALTCLVGKNESGKSALLQALYKLNPVVEEDRIYSPVDEYPRRRLSEYWERAKDCPDVVVMTCWELDDADIAAVEEVLGPGILRSREVRVSKNYNNQTTWEAVSLLAV